MPTTIGTASPSDLPEVVRLLATADLPYQDVTPALLAHYLLARDGAAPLGVVGLEPFGAVGLLRSLAVAPSARGRGLGAELTRALERRAAALGITQLYLLTTTAETFFAGLGYRAIPRGDAPPPIRGTTEFRELCATTSVCMVKTLVEGERHAIEE